MMLPIEEPCGLCSSHSSEIKEVMMGCICNYDREDRHCLQNLYWEILWENSHLECICSISMISAIIK
jgi:hypothetical protein